MIHSFPFPGKCFLAAPINTTRCVWKQAAKSISSFGRPLRLCFINIQESFFLPLGSVALSEEAPHATCSPAHSRESSKGLGTGGVGRGGTQQIKTKSKQYRLAIWAEARASEAGEEPAKHWPWLPVLPAPGTLRRRKVPPDPPCPLGRPRRGARRVRGAGGPSWRSGRAPGARRDRAGDRAPRDLPPATPLPWAMAMDSKRCSSLSRQLLSVECRL